MWKGQKYYKKELENYLKNKNKKLSKVSLVMV
jgi:hypothetical protein